MGKTLSHREAREFYDGFGAKQDSQGFYEDPPLEDLIERARFGEAQAVVEFGCGTGRLAKRLLSDLLPDTATYMGFDVSTTMTQLARARLEPWAPRAQVQQTDGSPKLPLPDGCCDRFVSTYVLDLLSAEDIDAVLREARRLLRPDGLLCLAGLTHGASLPARLVEGLWTLAHSLRPTWVGGCRPLDLGARMRAQSQGSNETEGFGWKCIERNVICAYGICTEVIIAQ